MPISNVDFAAVVEIIRPALIQSALRHLRCSYDEAEDVISDVTITALAQLDEYDEATGMDGLRFWLISMIPMIGWSRARSETRDGPADPLAKSQEIEPARQSEPGSASNVR